MLCQNALFLHFGFYQSNNKKKVLCVLFQLSAIIIFFPKSFVGKSFGYLSAIFAKIDKKKKKYSWSVLSEKIGFKFSFSFSFDSSFSLSFF